MINNFHEIGHKQQ